MCSWHCVHCRVIDNIRQKKPRACLSEPSGLLGASQLTSRKGLIVGVLTTTALYATPSPMRVH